MTGIEWPRTFGLNVCGKYLPFFFSAKSSDRNAYILFHAESNCNDKLSLIKTKLAKLGTQNTVKIICLITHY